MTRKVLENNKCFVTYHPYILVVVKLHGHATIKNRDKGSEFQQQQQQQVKENKNSNDICTQTTEQKVLHA